MKANSWYHHSNVVNYLDFSLSKQIVKTFVVWLGCSEGKVSLYRIFFKSELNITRHISIFLTQVQGDAAFSALIVNSYLYSHTRMRCCLFKLDLNSILSTWDISLKFIFLAI